MRARSRLLRHFNDSNEAKSYYCINYSPSTWQSIPSPSYPSGQAEQLKPISGAIASVQLVKGEQGLASQASKSS